MGAKVPNLIRNAVCPLLVFHSDRSIPTGTNQTIDKGFDNLKIHSIVMITPIKRVVRFIYI